MAAVDLRSCSITALTCNTLFRMVPTVHGLSGWRAGFVGSGSPPEAFLRARLKVALVTRTRATGLKGLFAQPASGAPRRIRALSSRFVIEPFELLRVGFSPLAHQARTSRSRLPADNRHRRTARGLRARRMGRRQSQDKTYVVDPERAFGGARNLRPQHRRLPAGAPGREAQPARLEGPPGR